MHEARGDQKKEIKENLDGKGSRRNVVKVGKVRLFLRALKRKRNARKMLRNENNEIPIRRDLWYERSTITK